MLYKDGEGTPKDLVKAAIWLTCAARAQHTAALQELERMFEVEDARQRQEAEQGDPEAQYRLSIRCFVGARMEINTQEGMYWLQKAAEQGHPGAQCDLGLVHSDGIYIPQNYPQAAHWLQKAAEQGHANAQYNLGQLYEQGEGVEPSYDQAMHWYRLAAEQGHYTAQSRLELG
jgi:TPR repeat protein